MVESGKRLWQSAEIKAQSPVHGERMEHRLDPRQSAWAFVNVYCRADAGVTGLMYNISGEGMFVLSKARVRRCECVDIMVRVGTDAEDWLCLPAMVVHRASSGFGVMFRPLDEPARKVVEQLLRPPLEALESPGEAGLSNETGQRRLAIGGENGRD